MSNAGKWQIDISEPYPAWASIVYEGETVARIHHSELGDLRYAVEKAMQEARLKLGKDAGEV